MAADTKTAKADPAPKSEPKTETAAKDKSTAGEASSKKGEASSKAESGKADAAPSGYSRGEGQKPVSAAYRENWNAIFAKGAKKSTKRKKR